MLVHTPVDVLIVNTGPMPSTAYRMPVVGSKAMSPSTLMYCVRLATNVVAPVDGTIVKIMPPAGVPSPPSETPYSVPAGEKAMQAGARLTPPDTVRGFDAAPVVVLMSHSVEVVVVALSMPSSGQVVWARASAGSRAARVSVAQGAVRWRCMVVRTPAGATRA